MTKRTIQIALVFALLAASFASAGGASAWSGCTSYVTVQWGDTLSGIAALCGTTLAAIRAANPGLGSWLYAGQVLYIPTGYADDNDAPVYRPPTYNTYVVKWGDTLAKIAARTGVGWRDIWAVNPQIYNPSLIYAGQVINLPAGAGIPPPVYNPPAPQDDDDDDYPSYPVGSYSTVKIDYKHGLFIRSAPGGSIIASALHKTTWKYNQASVFTDGSGKVWAEIKLGEWVKGYSTGWILVKDNLGKYFTNPPVDDN